MAKTRQAFYKSIPELPKAMQTKKRKPKLMAVVDEDNCTGCQVCVPFCPVDCIEAVAEDVYDNRPIPPVQIRFNECIGCQICARRMHPAHLGRDPHAAHGASSKPSTAFPSTPDAGPRPAAGRSGLIPIPATISHVVVHVRLLPDGSAYLRAVSCSARCRTSSSSCCSASPALPSRS